MSNEENAKAYWSATLRLLTGILIVWAFVAYGLAIILAPVLNNIHIGGYPFGFWWGQQGAIYTFIALIFYYAKKMGEIDRKFNVEE